MVAAGEGLSVGTLVAAAVWLVVIPANAGAATAAGSPFVAVPDCAACVKQKKYK